ncbi:cytochrome P450 [Daldinia caldariorum]|uniref:cytochrome P450 n=1 Tax=Daldinia caldariorum TaxID=326644 RepID=UPI002007FAA8|nr:cytochrome P450 [Daldinia caldariorum]KAI1466706.1 cytochrome P450 [Daldinia caldariorum]
MDHLHAIFSYGLNMWHENRLSLLAALGAPLGVLFHLTVAQMGDVEDFMYTLIPTMALIAFGIFSTFVYLGSSIPGALTELSLLATAFNAGLFSSMVIYRLFFHRLRKFPGPLNLKVSRFFSVFMVAKEVKFHKDVARLHEKYGDFIRVGPRHLGIVRKSAIPIIYGTNTYCHKSTWYVLADPDPNNASLNACRDPIEHKRRHKPWDKAFAVKSLQTYEPRIRTLPNKFVHQISEREVINVADWSNYLNFDIMGEVGFSEDFNCVSSGIKSPVIQVIQNHMYFIGLLSHVPWLLNMCAKIPAASKTYYPLLDYCQSQINKKRESLAFEKEPKDIMSWVIKAVVDKDVSASPTELSLRDDARLTIVAGSETSATVLANTLFFLAKYPHVLKKLQAEIDSVIPTPADWTYEKVKTIKYVDNVIDESQRLKPALLTGGYRQTPPEGIQIDEQFIPGNVSVFVPTQLIQTDPRYWRQNMEFIPERFGERSAEMGTNGAPFMPFSSGPYGCIGKHLAMMVLRISVSRLVQHFDISFADGETGEAFDTGAKDIFTTALQPLVLKFSPRK